MSGGFAGHLALRAERRETGRTVLAAQSFRAPYHISKPYWDQDAGVLLVQVVNPTAGILAGDRLESEIAVTAGAALLVTTPGASRIFHMPAGGATSRQSFVVGPGGWLEVRPEPLVPHRGSRFRQATDIAVAEGGSLVFTDVLMPGRIGHGEAWSWEELSLDLTVRAGGTLILRERLVGSAAAWRALAQLHGAGPEAAFANLVVVAPAAPDDAEWVGAVAAGHGPDVWLGVTRLRAAGWSIKLVATDNLRLRDALGTLRGRLARRFPRLATRARKLP